MKIVCSPRVPNVVDKNVLYTIITTCVLLNISYNIAATAYNGPGLEYSIVII